MFSTPATIRVIRALFLGLACLMSGGWAVAADATSTSDQSPSTNTKKIYKQVGPDGEVIYSDKPAPNSQEVQAPPTSSYKSVPQTPNFTPYQPPARPSQAQSEVSLTITSPKSEESIWSGNGEVTVAVSLSAPLGSGQQLEYQIDGSTVYTGTETSHTFTDIYRGAHTVTVQLVGNAGTTVSSPPLTFYMHRASIR